jgi:hypothetical protein
VVKDNNSNSNNDNDNDNNNSSNSSNDRGSSSSDCGSNMETLAGGIDMDIDSINCTNVTFKNKSCWGMKEPAIYKMKVASSYREKFEDNLYEILKDEVKDTKLLDDLVDDLTTKFFEHWKNVALKDKIENNLEIVYENPHEKHNNLRFRNKIDITTQPGASVSSSSSSSSSVQTKPGRKVTKTAIKTTTTTTTAENAIEAAKNEKGVVDWAQCNHCGKYRMLPQYIDPNLLPEIWFCYEDYWNNNNGSCDDPEE